MKPINLELRNYRAFTDAQIPLSGIEAASITGQNGAGKSTICEAILWTVYGDGRSSGVDGVVKLGADEASATLDYEHNGQRYRIIRKRSRGKRTDLQYLVNDGKEWVPLTGVGVRETQEKIVHDLAMDVELFRHSSCVMQGDSAGICEATPAERKAILYQIFESRLAKFGPLTDAAKMAVRQIDDSMIAGTSKREALSLQIAGKDVLHEALADAKATYRELQSSAKSLDAKLKGLRESIAKSQGDLDKVIAIDKQIRDINAEISSLEAAISQKRIELDSAQSLLEQASEIRAKCELADNLEAEVERYRKLKDEVAEKNAKLLELQSAFSAEAIKLENLKKGIEQELETAEGRLEELKKRAVLLTEVPCKSTNGIAGSCKLLAEAHAAVALEPDVKASIEDCKKRLKEAKKILEFHLANESDLLDLKKSIEDIGYDPQAASEAFRNLQEAKQYRSRLESLSAAEARAAAAQGAIAETEKTIRGKRLQIMGLEKDRDQLQKLTTGITTVIDEADRVERELYSVRESIDRENRQIGILDAKLSDISDAEEELKSVNADLLTAEHDRLIYATLQQAYGRDGIPALIIDAAVPAIEEVANDTLSSLSDGRMNLRFITQRLKSTGGLAETLDIIVSDSAGERPYEDFSGGEQLRIALSIRIALGKVLAQRSGSPIEFLALDEVCAPLDQSGEDALIDCIQRLMPSFGCILLITHRESLRDRLPQQITVSKNGSGSVVEVSI
jgi:exonuclease SbcC